MNSGLESVSGWFRASRCTATTPGMPSRSRARFAGTVIATPPYTVRNLRPTAAVGTLARSAVMKASSTPVTYASYRQTAGLLASKRPAADAVAS